MSNVLVINLGMKSIRSMVFRDNGEILAKESCPIETFLSDDFVEQSPEEWWEKAATVVHESVRDLNINDIDYLTVTSSSSCLVAIDKNAVPLTKCIMVSDKRAFLEAEYIKSTKSFQEVKQRTGIDVDSSLMLPKIMWIKNNLPELYNHTFKFLSPNDFFIAKMTHNYVTDSFNAHKYYFDSEIQSYPLDLLKEIDVDLSLLPDVKELGTVIGNLTEQSAKFLGLSSAIKVVLTTYDAICSFFGSGVSKEGEASDVSGTVTVFRALSKKTGLLPSSKIFTTPFVSAGLHIVGGSNNLGGGLIEWVKQCYYQNEPYPYEVMEKDARDSCLGAGGLIFLPYLLGERAPIWNRNARGCFIGLERSHTRREMTRAVFESTGFIDLDMKNAVEETGIKIKSIRLSGGMARINLISQIKADITGNDIYVLSEFETTASGAAMIALIGAGIFKDLSEASRSFVNVRMIIKPNLLNHRKYQDVYQLYKKAYMTLQDLFEERIELTRRLYSKHEIRIENL